MKRLLLAALLVIFANTAMAGFWPVDTWSYAWPNNTDSKSHDSLIMKAAITDTSTIYWFKKNNDVAQVWIDSRMKNVAGTDYKHPRIEYKWVDGLGNSYGPDSANGWVKLADSSHVTITAAAHVYQRKILTNKTGAKGVIFKGAVNVDSTITLIRITE